MKNRFLWIVFGACLSFGQLSAASNDVSNVDSKESLLELRRIEVNGFIESVTDLRGEPLMQTADLITGSGVSSDELYAAVEAKILEIAEEHRSGKGKKLLMAKELGALMRSLSALSIDSRELLTDQWHNSRSRNVRNRAKSLVLNRLDWYEQRNKIMQNPDSYKKGQALMTHRYLNLLRYKDLTFGRWAAEEIARRGEAEPVVYEEMANILRNRPRTTLQKLPLDTYSWYCKTLRKRGGPEFASLLSEIAAAPDTKSKMQRHCKS